MIIREFIEKMHDDVNKIVNDWWMSLTDEERDDVIAEIYTRELIDRIAAVIYKYRRADPEEKFIASPVERVDVNDIDENDYFET